MNADPETEQYRLFEAVAEWLAAASRDAPIVLVLDDLHWATRPTLLMLRHVVRADLARVLVMGTYRDTEPGALIDLLPDLIRAESELIELAGLGVDDVAQLVADASTAASVHAATDGNPFFVGEVVRQGAAEVSQGARQLVSQRLGRLSDAARETLTLAAVVGEEFERAVLAHALGDIDASLDEAIAAHLVREVPGRGLRYRFAHALIRSAIEDELSGARRARLHERIGQAVETIHAEALDDHLVTLARHWTAAAPLGEVTKAVDYARRAGDQASSTLALEDAAEWYRRAIDLLDLDPAPDEGLRCDLLIALGSALHWAGDDAHRRVLTEAAERARALHDPHRLGRVALALVWLGGWAAVYGTVDRELVAIAEESLAGLTDDPENDGLRAELLAAVAMELVTAPERGDRQRATTLSHEAVAIANRIDDARVLGRAATTHMYAGGDPDLLDERLHLAKELVSRSMEQGDVESTVRGGLLLCDALTESGDVHGATVALEEAERLSADLRHPLYRYLVAIRRVYIELLQGRFEEAERLALEASDLGEPHYGATATGVSMLQVSQARWQQGRAREVIDQMRFFVSVMRSATSITWQALMEAFGGEEDASRETLEMLDAERPFQRTWTLLASLVQQAFVVAEIADARRVPQLYEELLPYAERNTWMGPVSWGPVALALGVLDKLVGRWDEAEKHFRQSLELCDRMGARPWLARTRCEWAAMLRDRGRAEDREVAHELATQALETADALGMAGVAAKARDLLRIPPPAAIARRDALPFVGREAERAGLDRAWNGGDPSTCLVLIAGEPGAGKTRLASEFARDAYRNGATVLFGRCDDGLAVPFQPFVEALKHYANGSAEPSFGPLAPELTRLVPELVADGEPLKADPETEQYRLFEAVADWLAAASRETPIVLVLDDLQWATKPTLFMLRHVLRADAAGRFLIVGTYRDTEPGALADVLADLLRDATKRVELGGLEPDEVAALVEDEMSGPAVHAATGGNPFFIGELVRHRAESGDDSTPEVAREIVGKRLSRLSETAREVLTMAAVAGEEFELAVLAHSSDGVETALDEAIAAHLVREVPGPGLRYRFAHALVRSSIEDDLTSARRARLHQVIGQAIESVHANAIDDHLAALARHWLAAAPLGHAAKAVDYARKAGDLARASLSLEDAAAWYRRAIELLGQDEALRIDLLTALGEALHWAGDAEHRTILGDAANRARSLGDPLRLGKAAVALAPLGGYAASGIAGGDSEFVALAEEALAALGDDETVLRAELLAALARELRGSGIPGQLDRVRTLGREAVQLASGIDDVNALGRILYSRHTAHEPDNLDERTQLTTTLISVGIEQGDTETVFRGKLARIRDLAETGELNEMRVLLEEVDQLAGELRHPVYAWLLAIVRAVLALLCGPLEEAERWTDEAVRLGRAAGHDSTAVNVGALQAANRSFQQGRAAEWLESARAQGRPADLDRNVAILWCLMEAYSGEADACRRTLDGMDANRERGWMWLGMTVAMALAVGEIGDTSRAPRLYEELLPYAGSNTLIAVVSYGPVSLALGRLAATLSRWDDAETHFGTSADWCEREGAVPWLAMTRCEWAKMLRRRGRPEDLVRARELADQALARAEELGMARIAAQARAIVDA